jgi:hypothetical protein
MQDTSTRTDRPKLAKTDPTSIQTDQVNSICQNQTGVRPIAMLKAIVEDNSLPSITKTLADICFLETFSGRCP